MQFTRQIKRLYALILIAFLLIALSAAYWSLWAADDLLQREDNPRLVEAEAAIRRGGLFDRNGVLLAETVVLADGRLQRRYPYNAMDSALGYFSLRYGVGGAEAAYDAILRGDTLPDTLNSRFAQDVLHRPQVGSDVQLTLDIRVQQRVADALGDHAGAAVVLAVPSGDLMAMVSHPTYDPETLDADWEALIADPGEPFFNRALQGRYQPGGALQTALMAAAILNTYPLTETRPQATTGVAVGGVQLTCATPPPQEMLSLVQAYAYACPQPFDLLLQALPEASLRSVFADLRLTRLPTLAGFTAAVLNGQNATATPETTPEAPASSFRADAHGQGTLRVNPLALAWVASALVNDGNAPQPHALLATRAPNSATWVNVASSQPISAMLTAATASRLREIMTENLRLGSASAASNDWLLAGGHAALAFSGDETQVWFVGFVVVEGRLGAGVALVLEDSDDPAAAARIGAEALQAAHSALISAGR